MGELLHVGAVVQCLHQIPARRQSGNSKVTVSGKQVWTTSSTLDVTPGCPFFVGTKAQPCATVQWLRGATRVKAGGEPVLLRESAVNALCKSAEQIPQGVPTVTITQTRVRGI
jgi:hypothetical protein